MAQFYPNFTSPQPHGGAPAPIQLASATGITNASTGQLITVTWDTPFADANYLAHISVQSTEAAGSAESVQSVGGFTQTAAGVQVWIANTVTGKHFTVTAVGFHV